MNKFSCQLEITPWIAEGHDQETGLPAFAQALETMRRQRQLFDFVMPCVWACRSDGGFTDPTSLTGDFRAVADELNQPFWPLIAGACDCTAAVVGDPELRKRNIAELCRLLLDNRCAGVDVDYEFLPRERREDFNIFVRDLADELHRHDLQLALDRHPKVRPDDPWSIGAQAQDYAVLGELADILHVMCYDQYHFAYFYNNPGPVSTAVWTDAVAGYSCSAIPAEKLVFGLPTYGFDWNEDEPSRTRCIFYAQVAALREKYQAEEQIDELTGQPFFRYRAEDGARHIVYCEDYRSLGNKFDVLAKYRFRGLAFWVLTLEDQRIWDELSARLF